jgi:hypothetical protein
MNRCETREVYTISVDSLYASAPNASNVFTAYLNVPLRNVVRAELLSASIDSTGAPTSNVVYVQVEELVNKFHDHAVLKYQQSVSGNTSSVGQVTQVPVNARVMAEAFATVHGVPSGGRFLFASASQYPAYASYINPIRKLDRLTVSLYDQTGASLVANAPTFMLFRFECATDNQCLY